MLLDSRISVFAPLISPSRASSLPSRPCAQASRRRPTPSSHRPPRPPPSSPRPTPPPPHPPLRCSHPVRLHQRPWRHSPQPRRPPPGCSLHSLDALRLGPERPHHAHRGPPKEPPYLPLQLLRQPQVLIVQEGDQFPGRLRHARVPRRPRSPARPLHHTYRDAGGPPDRRERPLRFPFA